MTTGTTSGRRRASTGPLVAAAAVLTAWELAGHLLSFRPDILPTPSRVFLEGWRNGSYLLQHFLHTASAAVAGLLWALAGASAVFLACSASHRACNILRGISDAWLALPAIAAAPVMVHWLGYGSAPRTALVALVAFPIVGAGIGNGLRRIPERMEELMRSMHATQARVTWKVRAPFVLSPLLRSLGRAAPAGVAAALAIEFVQSEAGLGFLMLSAMSKMNTPLVFAGLLGACALAALLSGCVAGIAHILARRHFE